MLSETCLADLKDDNGISYQVLSYLRRISSNVLLTAEGEHYNFMIGEYISKWATKNVKEKLKDVRLTLISKVK